MNLNNNKNPRKMKKTSKLWLPMSNPSLKYTDSETQATRNWLKKFNVTVLQVDETHNINQPDVLIEGLTTDLQALVTSPDYGLSVDEAQEIFPTLFS